MFDPQRFDNLADVKSLGCPKQCVKEMAVNHFRNGQVVEDAAPLVLDHNDGQSGLVTYCGDQTPEVVLKGQISDE